MRDPWQLVVEAPRKSLGWLQALRASRVLATHRRAKAKAGTRRLTTAASSKGSRKDQDYERVMAAIAAAGLRKGD